MNMRRVSTLFGLIALVLTSGCCCCHDWAEHRACRRVVRPCARYGDAGCSSCSASFYAPACDCNATAAAPIIVPTPSTAPMPKPVGVSYSR